MNIDHLKKVNQWQTDFDTLYTKTPQLQSHGLHPLNKSFFIFFFNYNEYWTKTEGQGKRNKEQKLHAKHSFFYLEKGDIYCITSKKHAFANKLKQQYTDLNHSFLTLAFLFPWQCQERVRSLVGGWWGLTTTTSWTLGLLALLAAKWWCCVGVSQGSLELVQQVYGPGPLGIQADVLVANSLDSVGGEKQIQHEGKLCVTAAIDWLHPNLMMQLWNISNWCSCFRMTAGLSAEVAKAFTF